MSPDDVNGNPWLRQYLAAADAGWPQWQRPWPQSRADFLAADASGLLAIHPEWLPGRQGLMMLGLPTWFGRRQMPLSDRWCERYTQTLLDRPELLAAVRALVIGGAA